MRVRVLKRMEIGDVMTPLDVMRSERASAWNRFVESNAENEQLKVLAFDISSRVFGQYGYANKAVKHADVNRAFRKRYPMVNVMSFVEFVEGLCDSLTIPIKTYRNEGGALFLTPSIVLETAASRSMQGESHDLNAIMVRQALGPTLSRAGVMRYFNYENFERDVPEIVTTAISSTPPTTPENG